MDAEGLCVCAGGAEELLKRSILCGIDPREWVLLWMERGRQGHWMSHAEGVTMDGPTVFAALRRVKEGRFPCVWMLLERACGEPVEERKKSSDARHRGGRKAADPAHKPASSVDAVRVPHGRRESAGHEAKTMTALLAWSLSGPPGTAAGYNETRTPQRGVPHGGPADWLLFFPATSVTGRGLHGACNHRCHCQQRLRGRSPAHQV